MSRVLLGGILTTILSSAGLMKTLYLDEGFMILYECMATMQRTECQAGYESVQVYSRGLDAPEKSRLSPLYSVINQICLTPSNLTDVTNRRMWIIKINQFVMLQFLINLNF